jgi:hypothetical protein
MGLLNHRLNWAIINLLHWIQLMKLFSAIAASLALLVGLSLPALAARFTEDQAPTEQAATSGDTQIAGLLLSE